MNKKERFCDVDNIVEWRHIITALLALVAMTGQGQIKCHVEGTLETDAWGDEIFICEAGTDLRIVDEPRFHVIAKDGKFTYDIETDFPRLYVVFFLKQQETGSWFQGKFLAENCNVNVTMYKDKHVRITSNGEEGRKFAVKDSIEDAHFWNPVQEIDDQLENPDRIAEFFKADFLSAMNESRTWNVESLPQAYVDSVRQIVDHYMQNRNEMYTTKGWQLKQQRDSITDGLRPFRLAYAKEHPMLWTLYDVLDAIQILNHANVYGINPSEWEPYLTLYHFNSSIYILIILFTSRLPQPRQPTAYNPANPISTILYVTSTGSLFPSLHLSAARSPSSTFGHHGAAPAVTIARLSFPFMRSIRKKGLPSLPLPASAIARIWKTLHERMVTRG